METTALAFFYLGFFGNIITPPWQAKNENRRIIGKNGSKIVRSCARLINQLDLLIPVVVASKLLF